MATIAPHVFSKEQVAIFRQEINACWSMLARKQLTPVRLARRVGPTRRLRRPGRPQSSLSRSRRQSNACRSARDGNRSQCRILSDKAVFKNHEEDFGTPWHQDWSYWYGSHKVSVWVALDDVTPENGCLRLVPGSHLAAVNHDGAVEDDHGFAHRIMRGADPRGSRGGCASRGRRRVIFHDLTLHASHNNTSGKDRWVWIPTYRDARAEDPEYEWAQQPRWCVEPRPTSALSH